MITTITASLALLASQAPAGSWRATTLTPVAFAKRVDAHFATLSNKTLVYRFDYQSPLGDYAFSNCQATIVAPNAFTIQLPLIRPNTKIFMYRQKWTLKGNQFGKSVDPKLPAPGPLSSRPAPPAHPIAIWFNQFPDVMFSGLGRPTMPFSSLVTDAVRNKYAAGIQTRSLVVNGTRYLMYRILLTKGATRYELVFDGHQDLPVEIINTSPKGTTRWIDVRWTRPPKPLAASAVKFNA